MPVVDQAKAPEIISVCMTLPTVENPHRGLFVYRRLEAMSEFAPVRVVQPRPWFPWIRPESQDKPLCTEKLSVVAQRMFYFPRFAKSLDGRWMERCLARYLDQLDIDLERVILDAHFGYPEGVACHRVAMKRRIPFVVTLRGVEEDWLQVASVRHQMVSALNNANAVIAVSDSLRQSAIAAGVVNEHMHVVSNACNASVFKPGDRDQSRRRLGLDLSRRIFVTVARIHPVKGHEIVVRALKELGGSIDFQWICIGEPDQGSYDRDLKEEISKAGLSEKVRFVGRQDAEKIAEYLRSADLFLLGSRREGCCNAIREAMACSTPVVTTAVGDAPELAQRYEGIRVVPTGDHLAMSVAILETLGGSMTHSNGNRQRYVPRPWRDVGQECVTILQQCLNSPIG